VLPAVCSLFVDWCCTWRESFLGCPNWGEAVGGVGAFLPKHNQLVAGKAPAQMLRNFLLSIKAP